MAKFIWKITYAHVIAYFLAGIFALAAMNYRELFATESISLFMRPVTDSFVALGPALQIFRGIIIALAIYPARRTCSLIDKMLKICKDMSIEEYGGISNDKNRKSK